MKRNAQILFTSSTLAPIDPIPGKIPTSMRGLFDLLPLGIRKFLQLSFVGLMVLHTVSTMHGQDYQGKWNFNIGGGVGFPQGDLSNFADAGGNFVIGGGMNLNRFVGLNGEWMWHDLPINSSTIQALQTPNASARQYALSFDPVVHVPLGHKLGAYAIGGIGWYHRSGETTRPSLAVICDPYWSWWYGCVIGEVQVVTGSTSADAFGTNIGGGLTYRLGDSGLKFYTELRYHHASYHKVSTNIIPLTFGLRW